MARGIMIPVSGDEEMEGVFDVFKELLGGSDRVVAVVGGALVEELLTRAVRNFLRPDSKSLDDLFNPSGPLGMFSPKINIGYHLGCYGMIVRRDLHLIRKIRNEFAHRLTANFTHDNIRNWASSLHVAERYAVEISAPTDRSKASPPPENCMEWPAWVHIHDLAAALADPKERFLVELQALAWALSATHKRRVSIGSFG